MNAARQKDFPANYSTPLLRVLDAMSMTGLKGMKMVGTASVRSQQYAGDYDASEVVRAGSVESVAAKLQDIVKDVRGLKGVYFGDIKCGEVPEWNVFRPNARVIAMKVEDFNRTESQARVDELRKDNLITQSEADDAHSLLNAATTPQRFLDARKEIRFHILRWTPNDILEGAMVYRGKVFKLEDALASGGMVKMDVIAQYQDRFVELSVLYDIFVKGKRITAPLRPIQQSLLEDIAYYSSTNPFKALKRIFALARFTKNYPVIETLVPVLNSDLGRLYQIVGDMTTLVDLLSRPNPPVATIRAAIDDFRSRLGFLYEIPLNDTETIGTILSILKLPSAARLRTRLETLRDTLKRKLNAETMKELKALGKLPIKTT